MIKREKKKGKIRIAAAAAVIGAALLGFTLLFIQGVQQQLWEQSVSTIMESTRQGCNTLKIQLGDACESMETMVSNMEAYSSYQTEELETLLTGYSQVEKGTSLYLEDGACLPAGSGKDTEAEQELGTEEGETGIINPHISSATGLNVFDLFVRVRFQDGVQAWLVKEYEVDEIVDSFSLSFYNNSGFSYVINTRGDILIRSPHPNSNKTVRNLFDMLPETGNSSESLEIFRQSLEDSLTGYGVFRYQQERTVFCYTPLKLQSDWYLISIIPEDVVNAQTNEILFHSLLLIALILAGILILVAFYLRYVKQTSRKLSNQSQYIGRLYNALPEGVALLTVRQPCELLLLNEEGKRLLGYTDVGAGKAAADRTVSNDAAPGDSMPGGVVLEQLIHPEDYAFTAELFALAATGGKKQVFEHRVKRAGGNYFWAAGIVERTLDENGVPILIAAFHDITKEKLAQKEIERIKLEERTTLVGALSNAYPVIISLNLTRDAIGFIYIKDGLQLDMGGQKTYSELYEQMLPTIHEEFRREFEEKFSLAYLNENLGKTKNEIFVEARQLLKDGKYHWTSSQIIYVDNPYSRERLAIVISRRIDEQRYEAEQQRLALQSALDSARAASTAKTRFLSNMSHDIRTPMNAIIGMTAIAAMHVEDQEQVKECLKKISISGKHLISLINDILDMSKIESGKISLRSEPFNLAELAAECVELVRSQAAEKNLDLKLQLGFLKNENVLGDSLRVRQIYINIFSNAVKYTPEGGSVSIEIRQEGSASRGYQSYVLRCEDTGIGMNSDFLQHLFTPFERAKDSTSSKISGTGLGMAITKNLVDLMNGEIQVESAPGEGSAFTVTLPLLPRETSGEELPRMWQGVRILVADDDRTLCENTASLLEDMGMRPHFVTNGREAAACVAREQSTEDPYRLVILDWKMPEMDGVETTKQIRRQVGDDLPVIVLTSYDWSEIESEAREAGVTAFISKPFYRAKICYLLRGLGGEGQEESGGQEKQSLSFAGHRILLVEDNEINRSIARMMLESMELEIEEAHDGQEAVEMTEASSEGHYSLIFMDIQMPRLDGYEAAKQIRRLERRDVKTMPIIAMTANAFDEDVRAALHAGMNDHLAKPIDMEKIREVLERYLGETDHADRF